MTLNFFVLQVAVVFLPGILWASLDAKWVQTDRPSNVEFFTRAFVFGLVSYVPVWIITSLFRGQHFWMLELLTAEKIPLTDRHLAIEVSWAILSAIMLGVVWIYASNYKLMARFLHTIKATKRPGDEDVWDYTFNSPSPYVRWAQIRDFEQELVYTGEVRLFSESAKTRELLLENAIVYNFQGEQQYELSALYLAFSTDKAHIEFPAVPPAEAPAPDEAPNE